MKRVEGQSSAPFYVYIVRCSNGSYYVGSTQDLQQRLKAHNDARAAQYTSIRRPVKLVYSETYDSAAAADRRERQLKKWSHAKKEALAAGDKEELKRISKRRQ